MSVPQSGPGGSSLRHTDDGEESKGRSMKSHASLSLFGVTIRRFRKDDLLLKGLVRIFSLFQFKTEINKQNKLVFSDFNIIY